VWFYASTIDVNPVCKNNHASRHELLEVL